MNKKLLVALGCASILVCGCEKNIDNPVNISGNGELYSIVSGNKYDIYSHMKTEGRPEYQKEDGSADFSYPVVNIDNEDIKELNNKIKESFSQVENKLKSINAPDGCVCIKIDDEYRCSGEHLETQDYQIYDSSKYLTIQIRTVGRTYCAGGYNGYEFYTISKDTGKVLSKNELLSILKVDNNAFEKAIKEQYLADNGIDLSSFEYVKYGMYDDNTLIVAVPGENISGLYKYDGSKLISFLPNQEEEITEFKTTDGKVVFKNVETTQEIIDEFRKDLFDPEFSLNNIKGYASVNNIVYAYNHKEEDDTYAKYSGYFGKSVGAQYNIVFLINKKTGEIIEVNNQLGDSYNYNEVSGLIARFSGENNSVDFFKTPAGYFFALHTMNPDVIYTTSLKKLGMVNDYQKIEADEEGIYVYTEYDSDINPVKSSYTKFNVNGDKIS